MTRTGKFTHPEPGVYRVTLGKMKRRPCWVIRGKFAGEYFVDTIGKRLWTWTTKRRDATRFGTRDEATRALVNHSLFARVVRLVPKKKPARG